MKILPTLDRGIGAWFSGIAKQGEYYRVMIVTTDHFVIVATINSDSVTLRYEDDILAEVTVEPEFIDFVDKPFVTVRKKDMPKKFFWKLNPPKTPSEVAIPHRICMIHPGEVVPAELLQPTK